MRDVVIALIEDFLQPNTKIFLSEADFQHELALYFRTKGYFVRVEYPVSLRPSEHSRIDLVVGKDNKYMPIELKYITSDAELRGDKYVINKPLFGTKIGRAEFVNQCVYNETSYHYWEDVKRIEDIKANSPESELGVAIILTNNQNYWDGKPNGSAYDPIKLYNGRKNITGRLGWTPKNTTPLTLQGNYDIVWADAATKSQAATSDLTRTIKSFRYLILPR